MKFVEYFLILFIPWLVVLRIKKGGTSSFFNFCLYPLIFSYFYLLIPSLFYFQTPISIHLGLTEDSFIAVSNLSSWYVIVFLVAYFFTKDNLLHYNEKLKINPVSIQSAKIFTLASILICVTIFIRNGVDLIAISGNRSAAYDYYKNVLLSTYKIQVVFNICMISIFILSIKYKNLKFYWASAPYAIIDILLGGRGYIFIILMSFFLVYIIFNPKGMRKASIFALFSALLLFISAFFRRSEGGIFSADYESLIVEFIGEFYYTRLTAEYVYLYQNGSGDLLFYFKFILSKLIPQFLIGGFFSDDQLTRYDTKLDNELDVGFGLAGSIVSEAIYYGGNYLSWIAPIIMGSFYFLCHRLSIIKSLPGFIFFLLITCSTYLIFRSAFFVNLTTLLYFYFFYLSFFVYPGIKSKLFSKISPI